MTKEKVFSVFALGLLFGSFITTLTHQPVPVEAITSTRRRVTPTVTPIMTPTVTPVQKQIGGFYQDLTDANLNGAFLAYHDFSGFNFTNASLRDTNLEKSYLTDSILDNVDLTGANMSGVNLTGTSTTNVKWYSCPEGEGMCGTTTCPDGTQISTDGAVCVLN